MEAAPIFEHRSPRADHLLDSSPGLYALFLRSNSELPELTLSDGALLYIGKADGVGGLRKRCHFNGGTRNHSPRKSLTAILRSRLALIPVPVLNSRAGTYKTWQLEPSSERKLDEWMHDNLLLSVQITLDARKLEGSLIRAYAPPLNLTECVQSDQHTRISRSRAAIDAEMRSRVFSRVDDA